MMGLSEPEVSSSLMRERHSPLGARVSVIRDAGQFVLPVMHGIVPRNVFASCRGRAFTATVVPSSASVWVTDRKSTRLNSSHVRISYAVFCLKKKNKSDMYE